MWCSTARGRSNWRPSTQRCWDSRSPIRATTGSLFAASDTSSGLAFQRAPGHRPPTWPDPAVPQQFHLDIMVEDVAAAGQRVLALGAAKLVGEDVYADPAGHPFCLVRRPGWAPPIPSGD